LTGTLPERLFRPVDVDVARADSWTMLRIPQAWSVVLVLSTFSPTLAVAQRVAERATDFVPLDYTKVDRTIKKLPPFVAEPLHALFVFGEKGQVRMWAVLDKSTAELPYYDTLYFDKNANGDLTDPGERITTKFDEKRARAGVAISLKINKLPIPGTDLVHEGFLISTVRKTGRTGIWFRMKWDGHTEMSGGYGLRGSNVTNWTKSKDSAPILRPTPLAPMSFATWGDDKLVLKIGGSTHVNVIAGSRGSGPDTLAVVDENFLDLEKEELWVTVIGKDADGKPLETRSRFKEHC
tara:strand:+ start:1141 stop:2022 length:882 start_codon:yes stop_codon:yes gene_type:complete